MDEYTTKQAIQGRINALKQALSNTDYKAVKASEGHPSADWDGVKANREAWREEVDALLVEYETALDEALENIELPPEEPEMEEYPIEETEE